VWVHCEGNIHRGPPVSGREPETRADSETAAEAEAEAEAEGGTALQEKARGRLGCSGPSVSGAVRLTGVVKMNRQDLCFSYTLTLYTLVRVYQPPSSNTDR
jgi:hypothetical protein